MTGRIREKEKLGLQQAYKNPGRLRFRIFGSGKRIMSSTVVRDGMRRNLPNWRYLPVKVYTYASVL
ncbi:hypothetical protein D3C80_1271610 [compost metagenome]